MNTRTWTSLVGASLLLLGSTSVAQKITWKDAVGGSWNDNTKWDLNRVPIAGDSVFITAAGTYTVTAASANVRHLTIGGAGGTPELLVDVKGGAWLTVSDTLVNSGTLTMTATNLVSYQGGIAVSGGAIVNSGTLTILAGAGGGRSLNASLDNRGVVNVDWPLNMVKDSPTHINSGTINVRTNLTVELSGTNSSLTNRGTIAVDSGTTCLLRNGSFVHDQGSVSGRGTLRMEGVNGDLLSDLTVGLPTIQLSATTLHGGGTLIIPGTTVLTVASDSIFCPLDLGGTMLIPAGTYATHVLGRLTTRSSSAITLSVGAYSSLVVDSTFTNAGTLTEIYTGEPGYNGWLTVRNGWLINTGALNFPAGSGSGGVLLDASLDNRGTVNIGRPLTIHKNSPAHINSGTIYVRDNLTVQPSGSNASFLNRGTIAVDSGRTFLLRNAQFVQDQGTVNGGGTFRMEGVTGNLLSDFTVGLPTVQLSTTTLRGDGVLRIPETRHLVLSQDSIFCPVDLAGTMTIPAGSYATHVLGRLTTQPSSTITLSVGAYSSLVVDSTFTNAGTFNEIYTGEPGYNGWLTVRNGRLINAGTMNFPAGSGTSGVLLDASLENRGVVNVGWPLTINKASPAHVNSGTINLQGNLTVQPSGTTPTFTNSGTIHLSYGKAFVITAGALQNTSTSLLSIEIGGNVPNADLGQVRVSGQVVMDGTLNLLLTNNFLPDIDDSLALVTFWTRQGSFRSIRIPTMNGNPLLITGYGQGDVYAKALLDTAKIRELTIGQVLPDSLRAGYYRFYKVYLPEGVSPLFRTGSVDPLLAPQIFLARGWIPSRSQFEVRSMADLPQSGEIMLPRAEGGMHYMQVYNPELTPQMFTLQVDTLGYLVRRIRVPASGRDGEVTVEILGAKMQQGARAYLGRPGENTIPDTANYLVDPTQLNCRFPLPGLTEGAWDITVVNPDSSRAILPHGITLSGNTAPQLDISFTGPSRIHRDFVGRYLLSVTNPANTNVERALLFIETRPEIEIAARLDALALDSLLEEPGLTTWVDSTAGARFFCLDYYNIAPGRTKAVELFIRPTAYGTYRFWGEMATSTRANYDSLLRSARAQAIIQSLVDTSTYPRPAPGLSMTGVRSAPADEGEEDVAEIQGERERQRDISKDASGLVGDAMGTLYFPFKKPGPSKLLGLGGLMKDMKDLFDKYKRPRHPLPGPESVESFDPNDIIVPVGNGALNWVQAKPLLYRIEFENLADSATAPARYVQVRYRLDPALDPGSISLGSYGFNNMHFDLPASRSQYQTRINLSDSLGMDVDVSAVLSGDSLIWTFDTIDPATGWPVTDPMAGFLPINDSTGKGTGYVTFILSPRVNTTTGTRINAQAEIAFDSNTPVITPTRFNTLDGSAPVSRIGSLDDSSATGFDVRWSGSDDAGIASYSVYVSTGEAEFQPWVSGVVDTAGRFSGTLGSSYGFYSLAVDTAGNVERAKLFSEASTRVVTGVIESDGLPMTYDLFQNYPNPFNPASTIRIALPEAAEVTLVVYNILGQRVKTLLDERMMAGYHNIRFDAAGSASGVYFYQLRAGTFVATKKMLMLK